MNAQELPNQETQTETENTQQVNTEDLPAEIVSTENNEVLELNKTKQKLQTEITNLEKTKTEIQTEIINTQTVLAKLVQESLQELEQKKQTLQITVEQLERRSDRIKEEMRKNFAGVSQELAIRVQGFKDYLVGSLQDLAATAEELDLVKTAEKTAIPDIEIPIIKAKNIPEQPQFTEASFQKTAKQIRGFLDQYRTKPDYYGPPWQLRRTFEPIHAERVSNWFFNLGGRGAIRTMGSRLQNILISSAVISVLYELYEDNLRTLVLANSPERLGEWRRGLQDCLGISRADFGPEGGLILFESAEALAQKADRIVNEGEMPLIIIDETEDQISLGILQFPLWLAFAPNPQQMTSSNDFRF